MEEKYKINEAIMFEFANSSYYPEIKKYLENEKDRTMKAFFSQLMTSNEEVLANYYDAKGQIDQAMTLINKIEQIKTKILSGSENGKKEEV